jgi:xanthine dehydrogenase YagS FAD-binding subunit
MESFTFTRASTPDQAIQAASASQTLGQTRFVAGGTNLIDMMKLNVERPRAVVDINGLPLDQITASPSGGLILGALSQALLSGASPQLRNMATTAGNLLQRTRCVYFRDTAFPCNKREPGTGCSAIGGHNRMLAILGTSPDCIASNPSDQNVALTALEATIQIQGPRGQRSIPIADFYKLPGTTPHIETILTPGDLITSVTLPPPTPGAKSLYLKLRDRAAYEFALASTAIVLKISAGKITYARVALGGVGAKPWRAHAAETALLNHPADAATFRRAAEAALHDAKPQSENAFKVDLSKRCIVRALTMSV